MEPMCGTCVNLPRAGARRGPVEEATQKPITPLKSLQASTLEMGETIRTTVGGFFTS